MKEILFIATYPTDENIKDGMIRRINEIDKLYLNYKRIYLDISFHRFLKMNSYIKNNVQVRHLNFFIHFFKILKILLHSNLIYCHSMINFAKIAFFFIFPTQKTIVLDVHGIVPEEQKYLERKIRSVIYNCLERIAFKRVAVTVFVTNAMLNFYQLKYWKEIKKLATIVYPILERAAPVSYSSKENSLKFNIPKDKTIAIYSGNTMKWQNIALMIDVIKNNMSDSFFYIILTGQVEEMTQIFEKTEINKRNYCIASVLPHELSQFYKIANYGFILRDDHPLNRVANPTKLGEYLEYGIIPIVKLDAIGDYKDLGYEYISYKNFNKNLPRIRSRKNMELMQKYRKEIETIDLVSFIDDYIKMKV